MVLDDFIKEYQTPEDYAESCIDDLKNASEYYTVPRWHGQPNHVEIWIEKQALAATFLSFLQGRDVRIAINRGYASWSFLYQNCDKLSDVIESGKRIHILYFGDLDPSGDNMEDHLHEALDHFDLGDVDFQRIAVTEEQIKKFHLPHTPAKAKDTRNRTFKEKYGKLYAVELDALLSYAPNEFREMVQKSVDQYFNKRVYKEVLAENNPGVVDDIIHKQVRFVD